jgi:hypothetical protein
MIDEIIITVPANVEVAKREQIFCANAALSKTSIGKRD